MTKMKSIASFWHGLIALFTLIITTTLCSLPIFLIGTLKLIPIRAWQNLCTRLVDMIATLWCGINNTYIKHMKKLRWEIQGLENLKRKDWYLVISNHQSWLDIVVLQRLFNRKIPVLKFFIKDQLKWVPFLGFAWWAMGCPFMKRYTKEYLAKKPHKQGRDLRSTQKAIERFKQTPAAIMNFVEGTRFTPGKHIQQASPYQHLLKPRAGGVGFVISTMGKQLTSLIDVTIIYPKGKPSLWQFICRRMDTIKVHVRQLAIPQEFTDHQSMNDPQTQNMFRDWLNQQWAEKDRLIAANQLG